MTKLVFFDTETTGNTDKDYLCQIAYKTGDEIYSALFRPPVPIPPEASAIHHITNKMVADKSPLKTYVDYEKIKRVLEDPEAVVVAHNAAFDLMIVGKEGIYPKNYICTLKVARYLDKEGTMSRYNLQYLRYLLELEIEALAHDALGDVLVLEKLFGWLSKKLLEAEGLNEEEAIRKMVEISSLPSMIRTFNFGKHNGKRVEDVLASDRPYLEWLLAQKLGSGQMEDDWIYTLKFHLDK